MKKKLLLGFILSLTALLTIPAALQAASFEESEIIEVASILELRGMEAGGDAIYRITGEVILTFQQNWQNQKWVQDETAGIMIHDPNGIITSSYALNDGITGLTGNLGVFRNNYQILPAEDPGEATSSGNTPLVVERSLESVTSADQGRLIMIEELAFHEDHHDESFGGGRSYKVIDPTGEGIFRTEFRDADFIGSAVPITPRTLTAVVHMFNDDLQLVSRSLADLQIDAIPNIRTLRMQEADGETVYTLAGEAILTYQESWRNSKYVEDATGGILIDDPGEAVITTSYNIYDGITGLKGTLSAFGNMLQFRPVEDPGEATSTENLVEPPVVSLADLEENFMEYQARLVTIENVSFADATGNFANGQIYDITDGETIAKFRTTFFNVDYINDPIPAGELNITGLPTSRSEGNFLTARNWADIESLTAYSATFEITDEEDNPLTDATLVFRDETLTEAPYFFPSVPVGTHSFQATKEGYYTSSGSITVADDDVTRTIVMVAIDPDAATEFPMTEDFSGEAFPPAGWNHVALSGQGSWENDQGSALHDPYAEADSWLITPQIQLPDDESLLLIFMEKNQLMTEYGYSGVKISTGSGNPAHGQFTELYESSANIGIVNARETMIDLTPYAGKTVYLAFVYRGEHAHRWWIDQLTVDYAPEAIEVPNIAALLEQEMGDLIYRITGEVVITHLQTTYRGQFYIQDATGALLIDDAPGMIETVYQLYDGITNLTGNLGAFQDMMQLLPTEDPGPASSSNNTVEPLELKLADLNESHQGLLIIVRDVSFAAGAPATFTHNASYNIYDNSGEGLIRTPNFANLLDYFGEPVPDSPKDITAVVHQRFEVTRIQPRMFVDFQDSETTSITETNHSSFLIYPNPARTQITIVSDGAAIEQISIVNLSGQLVIDKSILNYDHIVVPVSSLIPGIYIVRILAGDHMDSILLHIH